MNINDVKKIAVLGAGDMGHGIAQVCAMAGFKVAMKDVKQDFIDKGMAGITASLDKLVSKSKMSEDERSNILNNLLKPTLDMKEAVGDAQVVIEAVPEIMDLKKSVFKEVSELAPKDSILATNTSTMSITEIGTAVSNQERFVGMHFFNPVFRMKLVEVIYGEKSADEYIELLCEVTKKMNKIPIKVLKDRPGFIVNRVNSPNQVLISSILDSSINYHEIDAVMKQMGMPMGPFELADFVGLDVFYHTMDYYAKTLSPEYKPGKVLIDKLEKKELGKKTGKGLYDWSSGKADVNMSKTSEEIGPVDFLAIQLNEAVRVYKEGIAASAHDIDEAMKYGTNSLAGPFGFTQGIEPSQLVDSMNKLKEKFGKTLFTPEPEVIDGSFKSFK